MTQPLAAKVLYPHWGAIVRACRHFYYTRIVNDVKKTARSQIQGAPPKPEKSPVRMRRSCPEIVIDSILTQNTRLDRLPVMTSNLVKTFGVEETFPLPRRLADASLEQLRACKVGYRAKYIKDVAEQICMGFHLEGLRQLPTEDAKRELTKLKGVGKYSADCIAYIGLHRWESAHFDINVRRTIAEFYGTDFEDEEEAKEFMAGSWGEFAGIALSYLERWRRK